MFCENCGTKIADDSKVCEECGNIIEPVGSNNGSNQVVGTGQTSGVSQPKKWKKKSVWIAGGVIAAVVILIVASTILKSFGDKGAPLLYMKEDGMFAMKASSEEPYLISEDGVSGYGGENFYLSEDGTKMIFIDNLDPDDYTFDLYSRNPKEEEPSGKEADEKGIRIASNVSAMGDPYFEVTDSGKMVLYCKDYADNGGKLYFNDLENEIKIDSNVSNYYVGDGVVFYEKYNEDDDSYDFYECELKKDAEKTKIDSSIYSYEVSGNSIYYCVGNSDDDTAILYVKEFGKDKVKIDKGIINSLYVAGDGTLYYEKVSEDGGTLYDYVNDDMLDADANMVEPDIMDYQTEELVDYGFFSFEDTVTDYDSYYAVRDAWYEKEDRDYLREELKSLTPYDGMCSICFYNGEKTEVVCKAASDVNTLWDDSDMRGLSYIKKNTGDASAVVDLSELTSSDEVYSYLDEDVTSDLCVMLDGGKESVIQENPEMGSTDISIYGDTLACLDMEEETLYVAEVSGDTIGELESIDRDVYTLSYSLDGENIYYYKDADDYMNADFYQYNGAKSKKLASDVYVGSVDSIDGSSEFTYLSDYGKDSNGGTGYVMKNGKDTVKIANDVYNVSYVNGEIYFIRDYSMNGSGGVLCKFIKEGKTEQIDEDVFSIIN